MTSLLPISPPDANAGARLLAELEKAAMRRGRLQARPA